MTPAVNEFTRGFIPFNPNEAFNYGLAMPAAYGFTEAQVRKIGVPAAYKAAGIIAKRKKRPVLVPVPGTGKSFVRKPPKKKAKPRSTPFVARKRAGVLTAQTRAPLPDAYLAVGQRSAMPPKALWATANLAKKRAMAASKVEQQRDAVAARRSSNVMPGVKLKPAPKSMSRRKRIGDHPDFKEALAFFRRHGLKNGVRLLNSAERADYAGNTTAAAAYYRKAEEYGKAKLRAHPEWKQGGRTPSPAVKKIAAVTKAKAHSKGVYDENKIAKAAAVAARNVLLAQAKRIKDVHKVRQILGVGYLQRLQFLMLSCLKKD